MTTCLAENSIRETWAALRETELPNPLELFRRLPVGENGEGYDLDLSPWAACVFDWWVAPTTDVVWIYLIQGSQTSKTVTMMGLLLYAGRYDPGPGMWVGALEEEVDKFCVQRLKPWLEIADAGTRTRKKKDWRKVDIRLYGRMLLHLAWATSGGKLRSWPCRYIFGDEVGAWPFTLPKFGSPLAYVKKRTRRYRQTRKGIFATTPSDENHPSWVEAKAANFYRWFVPCPQCGEYQYLAFGRVKFDFCKRTDGTWDKGRVVKEAFYECEHCQAHLTDADKAWMIKNGRAQCVDPDTGEAAEPDPANKFRTLQVPATYSLFTPWGELAKAFLDAKQEGPEALRIFVTDELAEPWRPPSDAPDVAMVRKCVDHDRHRGQVPSPPDDILGLTAGCDIQQDHLRYLIAAWSWYGACHIVTWGALPREPGQIEALDDVLTRDYDGHPVDLAFVDAGYDPDTTYAFCQSRRYAWASRGASGQLAIPVKESQIEPSEDRKRHRRKLGMVTLYLLNTGYFKAWLHDHIRVAQGDPGEWRLPAEADEDPEFISQILAETRIRKIVDGRPTWRWMITDRKAGNHYLDCMVYAAAAAWYPLRILNRPRPTETLPPSASDPQTTPTSKQPDAWTISRRQRPWLG